MLPPFSGCDSCSLIAAALGPRTVVPSPSATAPGEAAPEEQELLAKGDASDEVITLLAHPLLPTLCPAPCCRAASAAAAGSRTTSGCMIQYRSPCR